PGTVRRKYNSNDLIAQVNHLCAVQPKRLATIRLRNLHDSSDRQIHLESSVGILRVVLLHLRPTSAPTGTRNHWVRAFRPRLRPILMLECRRNAPRGMASTPHARRPPNNRSTRCKVSLAFKATGARPTVVHQLRTWIPIRPTGSIIKKTGPKKAKNAKRLKRLTSLKSPKRLMIRTTLSKPTTITIMRICLSPGVAWV